MIVDSCRNVSDIYGNVSLIIESVSIQNGIKSRNKELNPCWSNETVVKQKSEKKLTTAIKTFTIDFECKNLCKGIKNERTKTNLPFLWR